MRRELLVLVMGTLMSGATPSFAQSILAGEHDGFTRVVVGKVPNVTPDISQEEMKLELSGIAPVNDRDLASALNKIGNSRVAGVKSSAGGILIELNCNCVSETFSHQGFFVLDIFDTEDEPINPSFLAIPRGKDESGEIRTTLSAKCSRGAWCEDFLSSVSGRSEDMNNLCEFNSHVIHYDVLASSVETDLVALREYLQKGWLDEASLAFREILSATDLVVTDVVSDVLNSCSGYSDMSSRSILAWNSESTEGSSGEWTETPKSTVPTVAPSVDTYTEDLELSIASKAQNLKSYPLNERVGALLEAYLEVAK